jgi:hypothetical protein
MQKVAAYLLQKRNFSSSEQRVEQTKQVRDAIDLWLERKGAESDEDLGEYDAEDGSNATYISDQASDESRSWWMVQLDEATADGRLFRAIVSLTTTDSVITVYVTLEAGSSPTLVCPVEVDTRCPKIVRGLLGSQSPWYHGATELHLLRTHNGFDSGGALAGEIQDPTRAVPILVISRHHEKQALPKLSSRLAYDLAGLANVVLIDADAAWALTDELGISRSCFDGGVRLYWPRYQRRDPPTRHPLWTLERLRAAGHEEEEVATRERFRRQLRNLLMKTSALSVVRPSDIDSIRQAAARRALTELKSRAASQLDYEQLAESYARSHDDLRLENEELRRQLDAALSRANELERRSRYIEQKAQAGASTTTITPEEEEDSADRPPSRGEVRFYKKRFDAPGHDIMIRVSDCGCNNWESANTADKAKKGIAKLENGRNQWRSLRHCASCTGGGMWRVEW